MSGLIDNFAYNGLYIANRAIEKDSCPVNDLQALLCQIF